MREDGKPSARPVLKPCPCCGGDAHFRTYRVENEWSAYNAGFIVCMDCGMQTKEAPVDGAFGVELTEEDFAALWNRRAGEERVDLLDESGNGV